MICNKKQNVMHQGVGLLLGDKPKEQFYLQVKDETYPLKEWRGAYTFWGGAVELGEMALEAVEREVQEELPKVASWLLNEPRTAFKTYTIAHPQKTFEFTLFVATLTNEQLQLLSKQTPEEGYGALVNRSELFEQPWIWGLEHVMQDWLATASV